MTIPNALYSINITMEDETVRRASGVIDLRNGQIVGGDSFFYYIGSYTAENGRWKGELITHQHTDTPGKSPLFGGREVGCGFSGTYANGTAQVHGTALVGKASVAFQAVMRLLVPFSSGPI
jgi:hypothetical protein